MSYKSKERDILHLYIQDICRKNRFTVETEHRFDAVRRFRFDWAIMELKIAIEYEGLFSSKSRHTTISGYVSDCEKYNLAQLSGWKVLRYTASNYGQFIQDIEKILKP